MNQRQQLQKHIDYLLANVRSAVDFQETALKEIKKREENIKHCTEEVREFIYFLYGFLVSGKASIRIAA